MTSSWKSVAIAIVISFFYSFAATANPAGGKIELNKGWRIISEKDANANGFDMSTKLIGDKGFAIKQMPATVLNALSQAGIYKDLYYGDNLTKVADLWKQKWWYQTRLDVPVGQKHYILIFNGINYRAEVWLNGTPIAGNDEMAGMNRRFEYDVTDLVKPGEENILAVKITPESRTASLTAGDNLKKGTGEGVDLTDTWMDWINLKYFGDIKQVASFTPDKGAGIWRKVYLSYSGDIAIRNPYVETDLQLPEMETAHLTVHSDLTNRASNAISGKILAENTYWQASKQDIPVEMDPNVLMDAMLLKQEQWADFTALNSMPRVVLQASTEEGISKNDLRNFPIALTNPTDHIAFFVRAELRLDKDSSEILPITYSDNYVTIYPGETVQIKAEIKEAQLNGQIPKVYLEGYNVDAEQ